MKLTADEWNALMIIAEKSKMDCWFDLRENKRGYSYVYDRDEGKNIGIKRALQDLVDGGAEYSLEYLSEDEKKAYRNLVKKLEIK